MSPDPNCKHLDLIVQRNNGVRWVTCTDCFAEFVRHEEVDMLRTVSDAARAFIGKADLRSPEGRALRDAIDGICGGAYDHDLTLLSEEDGFATYECRSCGGEVFEEETV